MLPAALLLTLPAAAQGFEPCAPSNLNAEVNGLEVNLSWDWGNAGEAVFSESFEQETFPENWTLKNTYSFAPEEGGNWMVYDYSETGDLNLAHDGVRSALLMMAMSGDDEEMSTYHQDEWLMVKPGEGAVYMDFWYYLYPELLQVGPYQDFPDHYYVMISRDNGETWTELWDGRWDMGDIDAVQQASLFLGEPADEDTVVAFNAVSGPEESLYFLWAVDDVNFYTADEAATRTLKARTYNPGAFADAIGNIRTHRTFRPAPGALRSASRIPEEEWLNAGNTTFRVYLDGEIVGDYIKARHFTDYSSKEAGTHTYSVMAWSESEDYEYDETAIDVDIEDVVFSPATDLRVSFKEQEDGKYEINAEWEMPEGDVTPDHFNVYVNGKSIGWTSVDDRALGQSGIYKGAYTFSVEAVYIRPDGVSGLVSATVYPGTVPAPENLKATPSGNDVTLSWDAAQPSENALSAYTVFRGTEKIAELSDALTFTDTNVADGCYAYSVHAVYSDGTVSLPVCETLTIGEPAAKPLPYTETFDTPHLPADWKAELIDPRGSVKEMYNWRFDNWFELDIPQESGITGSFASISGVAAGMNKLECHLYAPEIAIAGDADPMLSFCKYYFEEKPGPSGPAQFLLQISEDNGESWTDLLDLSAAANGECKVSLAEYAGKTVMIRWSFLSRMSGDAAIDNVSISDITGICTAIGSDGLTDVYTPDGILVARGIQASDIANLPAGLYILKTDGKTFKSMVK